MSEYLSDLEDCTTLTMIKKYHACPLMKYKHHLIECSAKIQLLKGSCNISYEGYTCVVSNDPCVLVGTGL